MTDLEAAIRKIVDERLREVIPALAETPESMRLKAGLGLTEAADRAGIGRTTLNNYERGRIRHLDANILVKISTALRCDAQQYQRACLAVRRVAS